jgi:hypothetical protein
MRSKEEWFYRLHNSIKLYSNSLINSTIPIDQIEIEYNTKNLNSNDFSSNQTFMERIYSFPSINHDYLCLINNIISRCTKDFNIKKTFEKKIQHELKHLKLPNYIHSIRLTDFHFDNIYPKINNIKKLWFNHNGLWAGIDLIYRGDLSIEFTIQINLIRKQNSFILSSFKRWIFSRNNIQVLRKIIDTILIITV